jgi:hypothetical protein
MKERADWAQELTPTPTAPTAMFYGSSFKTFLELAAKFTATATVNTEMHITSSVTLGIRSQGNAMKIGEP